MVWRILGWLVLPRKKRAISETRFANLTIAALPLSREINDTPIAAKCVNVFGCLITIN
jgi:hypothetical protein